MSDGSNNNNTRKDLEDPENLGYGSQESFRKREKSSRKSKKESIRVSSFPLKLQQDIAKMNLDVDQNGELGEQEITLAIDNLITTSKYNRHLKMLVCFLVVFSMLLIACIFGATIAAARLSEQTTIDPMNGIMYAKGTHETMKTEEVKIYAGDANIAAMTNDELDALKDIVLSDGDVKFRINGYARAPAANDDGVSGGVKLLVDSGTITYGPDGYIVDSTGNAQELLRYAYPPDYDDVDDDQQRRKLASSCGDEAPTTSVSSSFNLRSF